MSFNNINGPLNNKPMVQSSQNLGKDGGGGGSTGYMNMRNKKKKKDENEEDSSVFFEEKPDTFELSKDKDEEEDKDKKQGRKFLTALSKFLKRNTNNKETNDSFERESEEDKLQELVEIEKETSRLERKFQYKIEDEEYEIVDNDDDNDDDFYNIDV